MHHLAMRAFKCVVELAIHEISAPGVRLANKDDLYMNVCLLGQQRRTRLVQAQFPLKFGDNLIFEKTFKFCRDELDVINFLDDLHVLIELIQLGRSENNQVMAWFELNAKDFLYPTPDTKPSYTSSLRDLFLTRANDFPGSISPQLIFSTTTRIDETQTPSLDILREYESRFEIDPVMELKKKKLKKSLRKKNHHKSIGPTKSIQLQLGTSDNNLSTSHTISSAIKADYAKPDVKFKLDELNSSVKKTQIIKIAPEKKPARGSRPSSASSSAAVNRDPFVVRKVHDELILRKPELHDVLHDGLVLTKKIGSKQTRREIKKKQEAARRNEILSRSLNTSPTPQHHYDNWSNNVSFDDDDENNLQNNSAIIFHSTDNPHSYEKLNRLSRSLSPFSLNENLARENNRSHSRNSSVSHHHHHHHHLNDSGENNVSNCEVCQDYSQRHDPYRDQINKSYPRNKSFSNYAPVPPVLHTTWPYARYYPWLFNYTEYLRELEDELYWLKVRSSRYCP